MNEQKGIRVCAVNYLNTKPLLFGLVTKQLEQITELKLDYPANCVKFLKSGISNLALMPVAAITDIDNAQIISNYCIGSNRYVRSVCIYSKVPLDQVKTIMLDFQSRTSVVLARVLCKEYFNVNPEFKAAEESFLKEIEGTTAAVVIGDKALEIENQFEYKYDLGEAWFQLTGLPFVFAAWVTSTNLDDSFIEDFNSALAFGINHIPSLMLLLPNLSNHINLESYFTKNISYDFDEEKKKALALFHDKLNQYGLIKQSRKLNIG